MVRGGDRRELVRRNAGVFEPAYVELRRFVRVGGLESDLHLLNPREFGANTAELVQLLDKGHYGVRLDAEDWERLAAWIDLNAPCHGTWREVLGLERIRHDHDRRRALRQLYGGLEQDPEAIPSPDAEPRRPIPGRPIRTPHSALLPVPAGPSTLRRHAAARPRPALSRAPSSSAAA